MSEPVAFLPPEDQRYRMARSGNQTFAFPLYQTLAEWEARAEWLREHLLVIMGLWPLPERSPLRAQVANRLEYDDYVIENVFFESWPGFYCTGNLYRPRHISAPVPAVLNPHGHWPHGRLEHQPLGSIRARCIAFARMGMIAFAYDMVGYNDSLQVLKHHFASLRGSLWGWTPLALQTWNSIRAIDYLQSLADVDPERIGCTGASGGGTQTFMLTAVDSRVRVAAPVNMVSAHFQGGCVCENSPGLRTETYNVEIAALAAPRPLLLVSATGDWTANTPLVEYPAVRSIYRLYSAEERLACVQEDAQHNYNAASRAHVYRWFARWFLGDERLGVGVERDFVVEPDERMRVFPTGELPAGARSGHALAQDFRQRALTRLDALLPTSAETLAHLRTVTETRLAHILDVKVPPAADVLAEIGDPVAGDGWEECPITLGRAGAPGRVVGSLYTPVRKEASRLALLLHGAGRAGLQDLYGGPGELARALLDDGYRVLALDLFGIGKLPAEAVPRQEQDYFWLTFNQPILGARVQDILTALGFLQKENAPCVVVGAQGAGVWALLAAALSPVPCAVCADMQAMDPTDDAALLRELYAPLLAAYGGLQVAAALVAPRRLLLANTVHRFPLAWIKAAYGASSAMDLWREEAGPLTPALLAEWLRQAREAR